MSSSAGEANAAATGGATTCSAANNSGNAALPGNDLDVIQDMIDISADRLEGLRTQCATSATLTQQEIRSLETKLVRMFSELLLTKARLSERVPASGLPRTNELKQWLRVVGLSQDSLNVCLTRLSTLEQLLEQNDDELKQLLSNNPSHREEEVRRLTKAMQNLRKCRECLQGSGGSTGTATMKPPSNEGKEPLTENLFWDSWDRHHHHHHHHHRGSMGNIGITASPRTHRMINKAKQHQQLSNSQRQSPAHHEHLLHSYNKSSTSLTCTGVGSGSHLDDMTSMQGSTLTLTLTPSPPNSPFTPTSAGSNFSSIIGSGGAGGGGSLNGTPQRGRFSGTPPPMRKHQTLLSSAQPLTPTHAAAAEAGPPLAKSKSNESATHFHDSPSAASSPLSCATAYTNQAQSVAVNTGTITRTRLHTDPSPDSYSSTSSDIFEHSQSQSNSYNNNNNSSSGNNNNSHNLQVPRSPIVTLGMGHTISHRFTKVFKLGSCDLCQKQMFFGLKCKECRYHCHKDCEPQVPPSCGLPPEFVNEFIKTLNDAQVGPTFGTMQHAASVATSAASTVNTSPNLGKNRVPAAAVRRNKSGSTVSSAHAADSSSPGSSCNSSSPSSPALFHLQQQQLQQQHAAVGVPNIMSSSGGGSSSNSSNMLSTPSSFHKHASQFNFPDVTITSNCNQTAGGGTSTTQTLYSQTSGTSELNATVEQLSADYHDSSTDAAAVHVEIHAAAITVSTSGHSAASASSHAISSTVSTVTSVSSSVSGGPGSFYQRKLSSAGVDKRGPFASELSDIHKSNDSDKTVSLSGSTSASTDSDRTPVRLDSTEDGDSGNWPRQNSLSLKEWDIPYGDLRFLEEIGKGRFGTVHHALWHGNVAVKLLKEDYLGDDNMIEAFKLEVANFKKTRHENLVLFMGACMNPPYLAIVTSLCKGNTLYTYIHVRRDKFTINKTTLVAQQISQGMGYLHARGINHKDLRTKNIFLENGKVIITDFGLFSSTKLLYCDMGLGVPSGWLCYLAPELMRALLPHKPTEEILPFSKPSDVYSFGTVWYELLCGEFPFKSQPPESIIWQVGRGMKQALANLQTSRDVKDILMLCWSYPPDDRPDFPKLLSLLERLPKKRLARSPSHPVQLSRSAESVF